MTQEEKQLLLKDLCARLPYEVNVQDDMGRVSVLTIGNAYLIDLFYENGDYVEAPIKPYLRPLSSMTKEERLELSRLTDDKFRFYLYTGKPEIICWEKFNYLDGLKILDWLNANHFDYRGLIPMGLALPAPDGMYNDKND